MLRPSRPLTNALLWLAIVLLPVRAWAAAAMPLTMAGEAVMQMQAGHAEPSNVGMPCHSTSGTGSASTDTADDGPAPQTCAMCDVCHGAFAALPSAQAALPALPPAVPCAAAVPPVQPAVLTGPERPPRTVLA